MPPFIYEAAATVLMQTGSKVHWHLGGASQNSVKESSLEKSRSVQGGGSCMVTRVLLKK